MNQFIKLFMFILLFSTISSCGADKLKPDAVKNQFSNECSYTSAGPAVCGSDGKEYLNQDHAQCFTTVKHIGHCQCSNTLMVCGSDGVDHTECDAINSLDYTIVKLVPCSASEL